MIRLQVLTYANQKDENKLTDWLNIIDEIQVILLHQSKFVERYVVNAYLSWWGEVMKVVKNVK